MYYLHTEKQKLYFEEAIRLHYELGYGEDRISKILPVGHTTVSRWIAIFAREKGKIMSDKVFDTPIKSPRSGDSSEELEALRQQVRVLEEKLLCAEIKAEAYDEMINVAEAKFHIPIRKKAGAKR